jgi:hypothetical protein
MRTRLGALAATILFACILAGCATDGTAAARNEPPALRGDDSTRVIPNATVEETLASAATLLQREFPRVRVDRAKSRVTTDPAEFTAHSNSGSARDLVGGRSVMRRIGVLQVNQEGSNVVARLRIAVERRDTDRQQPVRPVGLGGDVYGNDSPGVTSPLDQDAATSPSQNAVWTFIRRERTLERSLLEELRDQFARRSPEAREAEAEGAAKAATTTRPGQP